MHTVRAWPTVLCIYSQSTYIPELCAPQYKLFKTCTPRYNNYYWARHTFHWDNSDVHDSLALLSSDPLPAAPHTVDEMHLVLQEMGWAIARLTIPQTLSRGECIGGSGTRLTHHRVGRKVITYVQLPTPSPGLHDLAVSDAFVLQLYIYSWYDIAAILKERAWCTIYVPAHCYCSR